MSGSRSGRQPARSGHNPPHTHCFHIAGVPFGIAREGSQEPAWVGQPHVCCRCGKGMVRYLGPPEEGHGPHVVFEKPSQLLVPAPTARPLLVKAGG